MSIVLTHQVEASERSATELERVAVEQAGIGLDVEALMERIVDTFEDLNHYVDRWQADVEGRKAGYEPAAAASLFDLYVRLERTAQRTSHLGRRLEAWGQTVAGKPQFLNAWRKLKGIVMLSPDRVAQSFEQIRRGETKSLAEFADELSRDAGR
jgi:hypothetical protein